MTIVAIGTSLPEIVTGIIAAKNDETDLLLGNISGSNILNLCFLIGLGAVINPLTFINDFKQRKQEFHKNLPVPLVSVVVLPVSLKSVVFP